MRIFTTIKTKIKQSIKFILRVVKFIYRNLKTNITQIIQIIRRLITSIKLKFTRNWIKSYVKFIFCDFPFKLPKWIFKFIVWVLYDFSGIHFIIEKLFPHKNDEVTRPASNLFIWIVGIYTALWSMCLQSYDTNISTAYNILNNNSINKNKDYRILISAQYTNCPENSPEFLEILNTLTYFFKKQRNETITDIVKTKIVDSKNDLSEANLTEVDLSEANLSNADLYNTDLSEADLSWAYLTNAHLSWAYLYRADLSEADLSWAYLTNADLTEARLYRAYLTNADLTNADLTNADLTGANLSEAYLYGANLSETYLSENQIEQTKTFYEAILNSKQIKQIKKLCPWKLKKSSLKN
jgi:uncharacterized protein YjbI with pentapeptide repeats